MQAVLIVVHLLVAVGLIIVVLLQRSEGGALGMGGGGSGLGGLFSQRGAANTLTRTTVILGVVFFATSMALTLIALNGRQGSSILATPLPGQAAPAPGGAKAPPTFPGQTAPKPPAFPAPAAPPAGPAVPPTR